MTICNIDIMLGIKKILQVMYAHFFLGVSKKLYMYFLMKININKISEAFGIYKLVENYQ